MTSTRGIKKIEKPKPLKMINRSTSSDLPGISNLEEILGFLESLALAIARRCLGEELPYYNAPLFKKINKYGQRLEDSYKDRLDKVFTHFRNGSKDENVEFETRLNLLHLIESRARNWNTCNSTNVYYSAKSCFSEVGDVETPPVINNNIILGPGEILKSSGKFSAPTRVPGKNYYRDEIVIRNSDSGKVSPGAKERNVQITGPEEEKIVLAKQLMEDTIKRNASPVREVERDIGSNSSLNSSASDDSTPMVVNNYQGGKLALNKNKDEFKYKHSVTTEEKTLKLSSDNFEYLKWAKLILEKYRNLPENMKNVASKGVQVPEPTMVTIRQYTKEFLLNLSSCSLAYKPPPNWDSICVNFPNIVKQGIPYFDAVLYLKKWAENAGKPAPIVDANLDYVDSE